METRREDMTMRTLRPFWGRVAVIESPVDEETRRSGLIVPLASDSFKRGVVIEVDTLWDASNGNYLIADQLRVGTVVYYRDGTKIGDAVIVERADILAYESGGDADS